MYGVLRAAGFTAAVIGAATFPAFADPSQAFELQTPATAPSYTDHVAAQTDLFPGGNVAAEPLTLVQEPDLATAVDPQALLSIAPADEAVEKEPVSKRSLLALVDEYASTKASDAQLECLAGAIYFESKGEPLAGQLAVAEVIINRTKSGRYPTTPCGVVKQRGQFSFVRGGRLPPIPKASAHWRKAVAIAHIAIKDLADSPAENALSFHATYVSPGWRMKRVATVGNHVFYR